MSTHQNAYEIRLSVLSQAQSNCWDRYHNDIEAARLNAMSKLNPYGPNGIDENEVGDYITAVDKPSAEMIIREAAKLYDFVQNT